MNRIGIVRRGKLEYISGKYTDIVEKVRRHGIKYPDHLTGEEVELANKSIVYFDLLAMEIETQKRRVA